eukprot:m.31704 g.31704  ORF g.31704 m.31704 type:complete len:420 (-) comp9455_c0_seq1:637-1896(-)
MSDHIARYLKLVPIDMGAAQQLASPDGVNVDDTHHQQFTTSTPARTRRPQSDHPDPIASPQLQAQQQRRSRHAARATESSLRPKHVLLPTRNIIASKRLVIHKSSSGRRGAQPKLFEMTISDQKQHPGRKSATLQPSASRTMPRQGAKRLATSSGNSSTASATATHSRVTTQSQQSKGRWQPQHFNGEGQSSPSGLVSTSSTAYSCRSTKQEKSPRTVALHVQSMLRPPDTTPQQIAKALSTIRQEVVLAGAPLGRLAVELELHDALSQMPPVPRQYIARSTSCKGSMPTKCYGEENLQPDVPAAPIPFSSPKGFCAQPTSNPHPISPSLASPWCDKNPHDTFPSTRHMTAACSADDQARAEATSRELPGHQRHFHPPIPPHLPTQRTTPTVFNLPTLLDLMGSPSPPSPTSFPRQQMY